MAKRNIGNAGEARFKELCELEGLTANRSLDADKYGWDYIVEFPSVKDRHLPLDESKAPIEFKVQVKSTDKKIKKVQVKVSTLYRLIKYPLPAFFIFIEYSQGNEPEAIYIRHVDEELIRHTLKRVRKLEVEKNLDAIHKRKITISYNDENRLLSVLNPRLTEHFQSYIPDGLEAYMEAKARALKTLGYKKAAGRFQFSIKHPDAEQEMVDLYLGLRDDVEITPTKMLTERFGIELSIGTVAKWQNSKLSLPDLAPTIEGIVFFAKDETSPHVEFPAAVYLPEPFFWTEGKPLQFRIVAEHFEIIFTKTQKTFRFGSEQMGSMNIEAMHNYLWLLNRLYAGKKTLMGFFHENIKLSLGEMTIPKQQNIQAIEKQLRILDQALTICVNLKIPTSRITTNPDLLLLQQSAITILHDILTSPPADIWIACSAKENKQLVATDECLVLFSFKLAIGSSCIAQSTPVVMGIDEHSRGTDRIRLIGIETLKTSFKIGDFDLINSLDIEEIESTLIQKYQAEDRLVMRAPLNTSRP